LSTGLATRRAFHRTAQVVGAVVVGPVGSGELIQAASLASHAGPRESRQVSLPIDAARAVGGRLVAGDIVDVAATLGAGGSAETTWIVRRHVLAPPHRGQPAFARTTERPRFAVRRTGPRPAVVHIEPSHTGGLWLEC